MTTERAALTESERNRLLRRVDWRFLLPDAVSAPGRIVADLPPGDPLLAGLRLVACELVAPGDAAPASCDLAVIADPDPARLAVLAAALRPGGSCYIEFRAPWRGRRGAVRRLLGAAGLTGAMRYFAWPAPWRRPTAFWVPLEPPEPWRSFLASRPPAMTRRARAGAALVRLGWRLALRVGISWPLAVVATRPGAPGGRAGGTSLLLTGGGRSINKVVALDFPPDAAEPGSVVKYARVPESIPALRREAAVLEAVHAAVPGGVAGVPLVLFVREDPGGLRLGETVVSGHPVYTSLTRARFRELAERATRWQLDLARGATLEPPAVWYERLVAPLLAEVSTRYGAALDPPLLKETTALAARLPELLIVPEQRDFSPWNVLTSATGSLAVLDWESAEPRGLPLRDLAYFLAWLAFFVEGASSVTARRASYRALLDPTTALGRVAADCTRAYLHGLGLPDDVARPLRALTWLLHACSDHDRIVADGLVDAPSPSESLHLGLLEEELANGR